MQDHNDEEPLRPPGEQHQVGVGIGTYTPPPCCVADSAPIAADGLAPARALRRARWRQLAAVAFVVVAGLTALAITAGGNSAPPQPGSPRANTIARTITALLADIPQSANVLGEPTAAITLKWYGDLECPFCREFALGALPTLITRWVRAGQLKLEYLSMETATREPKVFEKQQVAALAAGLQDKMWNYIETFYHEQGEEDTGYVTEGYLDHLARQIPGLNIAMWSEDRHDPLLALQVLTEAKAARHARYRGTPTFLIGYSDGKMYRLAPHSLTNPKVFNEALEYFLRP